VSSRIYSCGCIRHMRVGVEISSISPDSSNCFTTIINILISCLVVPSTNKLTVKTNCNKHYRIVIRIAINRIVITLERSISAYEELSPDGISTCHEGTRLQQFNQNAIITLRINSRIG